jgi:integrase
MAHRTADETQSPVQKERIMQNGSLMETKRRSGQSVREISRRDRTSGKAVYRRIVVGTIEQFTTEAARSSKGLLSRSILMIRVRTSVLTMSQLIEHYRRRELSVDNAWKSYATKMGYENYLKRWIAPRWDRYPRARISRSRLSYGCVNFLARGSCAKIRNIMSVLINHACRHEL